MYKAGTAGSPRKFIFSSYTSCMQVNTIKQRIQSIDILRGIIMAIMALDHVRDFFHDAGNQDPTDLQTTTPVLFLTRWITHFCAPTFVFLSGVSVYLQSLRKTKKELSFFLLTRGLWLIVAELTIVSFGWSFDPSFGFILLQVIWAIGWGMLLTGLLVWLPYRMVAAIGLLIFFGHDVMHLVDLKTSTIGSVLVRVFFTTSGDFYPAGHFHIFAAYAIVPWLGIMLIGYAIGKLFDVRQVTPAKRRSRLLLYGAILTALFIVLRLMNGYGDPRPWADQPTTLFDFLSFLNVSKYPPSLLYSCMTLGPAMIALALLENVQVGFNHVLNVFGRVPFYYYLWHLYLIHLLKAGLYCLQSLFRRQPVDLAEALKFGINPGYGLPLWGVYLVWLLVLCLLYPLCRQYNAYKSTHRSWWLSYI
jgi:uncharacterized membrane protein